MYEGILPFCNIALENKAGNIRRCFEGSYNLPIGFDSESGIITATAPSSVQFSFDITTSRASCGNSTGGNCSEVAGVIFVTPEGGNPLVFGIAGHRGPKLLLPSISGEGSTAMTSGTLVWSTTATDVLFATDDEISCPLGGPGAVFGTKILFSCNSNETFPSPRVSFLNSESDYTYFAAI